MLAIDWEKHGLLYHWPESTRLKNAIENHKNSMCYTMPGIKNAEYLVTDTSTNVQTFFDEHFSQVDTALNQEGLAKLMKLGYLEQVLNATTFLLTQLGQGLNKEGRNSQNSEISLQIWALRFQILMLLKMEQQAIEELNTFEDLDAPDLYFQYYSGSERKGTMVPFSLRLMHAEILRFSPFPWQAVDRIAKLKKNVEWIINDLKNHASSDIMKGWRARLLAVDKVHARILYSLGEYEQSMATLATIRRSQGPETQASINLQLSRMAMCAGDEEALTKYLNEAGALQNNNFLIHKTLRSIFMGAYPHAHDYIQRLQRAKDSRPVVTNLHGIVLLYTGKVHDGVRELSKCITPIPEHLMTNIKTMSELGLPAAQKETLLYEMQRKCQYKPSI